jgi:hypothetical protein
MLLDCQFKSLRPQATSDPINLICIPLQQENNDELHFRCAHCLEREVSIICVSSYVGRLYLVVI